MKRILCIVGSMNAGGAETFLMKINRNLDHDKYGMDFCCSVKTPGFYDDEIKELGGKILYTVPKSKGFVKSFMTIKKIVKENKYEYVMRVSQHSLSGLELLAAKLGGAKTTVFRSSNTQTGGGKINQILHKIFLPITKIVPDIKIAPSSEAGIFMFGKKAVESKEVLILPNGLDTKKYSFNKNIRNEYRNEMKLNDKLVIGHVGRFVPQKNHEFLIDVFQEFHKLYSNSELLLIGDGKLKSAINDKVRNLNLEESIRFLGIREDIPNLMNAMDVYLFPSFFEGMPNTVIEAQTSGLPCFISDSISKEVAITDQLHFVSLNCTVEQWAKRILRELESQTDRTRYYELVKKKGYDVSNSSKLFIEKVFK